MSQNENEQELMPAEDRIRDYMRTPMMLINEVHRLMWDRLRQKGMEHPVSQKSGQLILIELAKHDGRTQLELANAVHLKPPTISVSLQKLERDGYVTRQPDEYDLRATRVFLTDKGRELDNRLKTFISTEETLSTSCLTDEERETLVNLLLKVRQNLIEGLREEDHFE